MFFSVLVNLESENTSIVRTVHVQVLHSDCLFCLDRASGCDKNSNKPVILFQEMFPFYRVCYLFGRKNPLYLLFCDIGVPGNGYLMVI